MSRKQTTCSRRDFLRGVAATGAFTIIPASVLHGATAPSNQITRALIGFGEIAHSGNHLGFKGSRLVGLCDPDVRHVREGLACAEKKKWGKIRAYRDFLELLADPGVDVVHICTPPHWHGCMSVMAARAGKDIWCEKPMTRTIAEGKRVMDVVAETKRMFRLNTWFRFQNNYYGFGTPVAPVKQVMDAGLIGKGPFTVVIGEGQGFTLKFGWSGIVNGQPEPVPEGFDYDMWLGPAPYKPYHPYRTHATFRGYWDYDGGGLGDMGQHYLDPVQYLLGKDETSPVEIEYRGVKQHPETVGTFDRITLVYADGSKIVLDGDESLRGEPFIRGPKGCIWPKKDRADKMFRLTDAAGKELDAFKIVQDLPQPAPQQTDFMDSVRTRKPFALNERNGFRSCTIFNLAIVAMRLGRGFRFDPVALRAVDDPAADAFIRQPMRQPWEREMFG